MDIQARAYKATAFLINREGNTELPCNHCLGQGVIICQCIYQHSEQPCSFCFGTGVDPDTFISEMSEL